MSKEQADKKKAPPFKALLESSGGALGQFELAKLAEVADLRAEIFDASPSRMLDLIMEQIREEILKMRAEMVRKFDRMVDVAALALLARWLRTIDRQELVRQLLESSTVTIDGILADAKEQIRNSGRSAEESEAGRMPMRIFPPGVAHRNASKRYQAANIGEGKCSICPEPLDRNSVRFCTKHLAIKREKDRQKNCKAGKRGNPDLEPGTRAWLYGNGEVEQSTHGKQPGTLKALKEANEKRKEN